MTSPVTARQILSDPARKITPMHHPWRLLRDRLPGWSIVSRPMPRGLLGETDVPARQIHIDSTQMQAQRRCTLDHELHHAEAGDVGCHPKRERAINASSARRLIPLEALLAAVVWAHDYEELADELWVDVATAKCRIEHLHATERYAVRQAIANRDFHEVARQEELS
jgi:hypothetical protein